MAAPSDVASLISGRTTEMPAKAKLVVRKHSREVNEVSNNLLLILVYHVLHMKTIRSGWSGSRQNGQRRSSMSCNYVNKEGIGGEEETHTMVHWRPTDGQHLVRGVRGREEDSKKMTVNIWLVRRRRREVLRNRRTTLSMNSTGNYESTYVHGKLQDAPMCIVFSQIWI